LGCPPAKPLTTQETFPVTAATEVDALWVIDDSVSMADHQRSLALQAPAFFAGYGAADLNVGMTTTSADSGNPDAGVITWNGTMCPSDSACMDAWTEAVIPGTDGDDQERGYGAAIAGLTAPLIETTNAGFLRAGALHLVVIVSDENDCTGSVATTGEECYTLAPSLDPVTDLLTTLLDVDDTGRVQLSGIVASESSTCSGVMPGTRYLTGIDRLGGVAADVCADDYGDALSDIAAQAAAPLSQFRLTAEANPATIEVTVNGVALGTVDWSYDDELRLLTLSAEPSEGDEVVVEYMPL
jgi:hypothetical protein